MKPGQIDLFTKRVRRPPDPLERELHIAVMDTLKKGGLTSGWVVLHPANGEDRKDNTGALLKRMGVLPGASDLLFCAPPYGRFHALELKRRGKKPTQEQWDFINAIQAAGGVADWCDSYDDAMVILKHWGALSERMHIQG